MTQIEMQAMNALIGIHREMRNANDLATDRCRLDVAMRMLPTLFENIDGSTLLTDGKVCQLVCESAVRYADALIAELKKSRK